MKHFFTTRLLSCLMALVLLWPALAAQAQNITQADFAGVVVPQYLSSGNNSTTTTNPGPRLAFVFRGTLTNLTASTTYRYFVQAATATDFGTTAAAGVVLSLTPGTTPATSTYATSSTGSLSTAGSYATFTTDATGNYTGWFGFVNSTNARFITSGNVLYPMITLATDAAPATIVARRALDLGATVVAFGSAATTNGTLLTGSSSATPKNLVFTYDNTAGTGRPISGGLVEAVGVATGTIATYATADGSYAVVLPTTLPNGVRRVEERSIVTGAVQNCNNDADGVWPSGANTVNPTGGAVPVVLTATDTPLNAGCGAAATATITATPATLTAFTATVGTASATQTLTVGGTSLTAGIVVTAPAGYQVSLSATTGFAASVTVPQTAGTAANTPVYVRLTGAATGTYAGNVALTSTGATTVNVAVTGTVSAVATPAPTITSFTPATGAAGATVTITGTNFTGATAVTLNGVAITGFTVVSATSITFVVPATATSGTIAVTTPSGTATSATSFTVTPAVAAPTVSSFSPARAIAGTGFTLTVNGTNLVAGTTISFNGGTYTGTILGSTGTGYTVVIPASGVPAVGTYNITATNAGGTSAALSFQVVAAATSVAYEDFEQGTKGAYATGIVSLRSGDWTFTDALLGNQFNDKANQVQSARIRGGSVAMNFDKTTGAGTVTLNAAIYGTDAAASLILEVSSNGGTTYTAVGSPAVLTTTLAPYTFTVNRAGNVRFRISSSNTTSGSNPRINVDDLNITNFTGTATTASQALPGLTVFPNPAADRLTVALPAAGAATVALRDLTGRVVLAPAALAADQQLRLPASLAKGIYLLEVRQGGVTAVRRIEKN